MWFHRSLCKRNDLVILDGRDFKFYRSLHIAKGQILSSAQGAHGGDLSITRHLNFCLQRTHRIQLRHKGPQGIRIGIIQDVQREAGLCLPCERFEQAIALHRRRRGWFLQNPPHCVCEQLA